MAGEIISIVAQTSSQPGWGSSPAAGAASEGDAARFSELMSQPLAQVQPPQPAQPPEAVAPVAGDITTGNNSLGDRMLKGINSLGNEAQASHDRIAALIGNDASTLTPSNAIRLQVELITMSVHMDVLGKCASKAGQHFDTLLKLQ